MNVYLRHAYAAILCNGNAATFGDHQRVCKVSSTPEACVGLGRCPVRAQGSKVRFADIHVS
jgi:hypothetical protein